MNGLCRELMTELLAAGAATAKDYDPNPEERNAGSHGKRIVTLFGELPEILRTYFWNEDRRKGHYPFDDRLGLVGRYTPAAADEMIRCAVDHPYKDAAEVFSRNHGFKVSADTIREVVELYREKSSRFVKDAGAEAQNEADARAETSASWPTGPACRCARNACRASRARTDGRKRARSRRGPYSSPRRQRTTSPTEISTR